MSAISYALREKNYHTARDRLAKLRALYWIVVRRHETEICGMCGRPVGVVWWCHDRQLWNKVNGRRDLAGDYGTGEGGGGLMCIPCFDAKAKGLACWIEWAPVNLRHLECANGSGTQS